MKNQVIKNWLKAAVVVICTCAALVLLMAEPSDANGMGKFLLEFIAMKAAAIVCGYVAYKVADDLTKEIKEA